MYPPQDYISDQYEPALRYCQAFSQLRQGNVKVIPNPKQL